MNIEHVNKDTTKFEELYYGTVFKTRNNYYMKTASVDRNGVQLEVNAVNLTSGSLAYFDSYTDVEVIDAILTIKDESAE